MMRVFEDFRVGLIHNGPAAKFISPHAVAMNLNITETRCSAVPERPRCRVRYSFPKK